MGRVKLVFLDRFWTGPLGGAADAYSSNREARTASVFQTLAQEREAWCRDAFRAASRIAGRAERAGKSRLPFGAIQID